ncbi:MAG TPA: PAS domain S-box protein [Dyella sp.]|uniref:PAS domain S-box protein n=1 Tax=Dyella sp. TaxID=1869338 RepID=UPI002BEF57E4|nr:PAS domain S-box protein [Dyella sp.]HTV84639.1 PAS domain S-box protein [Dyella sp.]
MFSRQAPDASLFQSLFETAPDAMIVVDLHGTIVLANAHAERLFGYEGGKLAGLKVEALLPAAIREAHIAHRTHYMSNPRVRPMGAGYELTGIRADGQSFPVEIGLSPVVASVGTLFAASIRDISETQRARQALQRARFDAAVAQVSRSLLEAAHHEKAIIEVPGLVTDTLQIPAAAIMLADTHRARLHIPASIGLSESALAALSNEPTLQAIAHDATLTGDAQSLEQMAAMESLQQHCPALSEVFLDAAVVPLPDRRGPTGLLLAFAQQKSYFDRDRLYFLQSIANILAAAVQRGRSEEQLAHSQRLDALGQLTGGIAHDFNNLLTVISGNLQLLEIDVPEDPATRETLESASRAVERGAALTRKLLAFSRRQHLLPRVVRTLQLLADVSDMLRRTLGEQVTIAAECASTIPPVYADPGELEAALINLALNARDAMPRGGRLAITARAYRASGGDGETRLAPGDYVMFAVSDTGVGMSADVLAHALDPFFTTKEAGKGSGLGLSMVYGFVKQSGGHLNIESQPGRGTRVELYLPVAVTGATEETPLTVSRRGHETVLVVEDEHEVRRVATTFLRSLGYVTYEASNAHQALEQLAAHPDIDLLFSDVVLGGNMTGFELAAKAREKYPHLPVLFTSGYEYASMDIDSHSFGSFELLRKPYRREQLGVALRRVLDREASA